MNYLRGIEISRVEMSPGDESTFTNGGSKKAIFSLAAIKFIELCLLIACIAIIDDPANNSHYRIFITTRTIAFCYVTFGALTIYTGIYLIMLLFGDSAPWKTASLWSIIGFILFLTCTALLFSDWSNTKNNNFWHPNMYRLDLVCAAASVSLVASIVFLIDILLTIRLGSQGDLE